MLDNAAPTTTRNTVGHTAMLLTRDAAVAALLLCSGGIPTITSFYLSPSSWTRTSKSSPQHPRNYGSYRPPSVTDATTRHGAQGASGRRECSSKYVPEVATTHQYTAGDLEGLTRREIQALCKKLQVRAVGKTSTLLARIQQRQQHEPLETATSLSSPQDRPSSFPSCSSGDPAVTTVRADDTNLGSSVSFAETADSDGPSQRLALESPNTFSSALDRGDDVLPPALPAVERGEGGGGGGDLTPELLLDDVRPVFEELADEQWPKLEQLGQLLTEWNGRVNLISRKDIANVMRRHVVPCLAMAKALGLEDGVEVLDVGTGGGLPGLPLAIFYPNVRFTLIDGTGKKIYAVQDMAERLGLTNVRAFHVRAEEVHETFDFVMGRAVTSLPKFVRFVENNLKRNSPSLATVEASATRTNGDATSSSGGEDGDKRAHLKRGILYMRGEVSAEELAELGAQPSTVISLQQLLDGGAGDDVRPEDVHEGVRDRGYSSVFHFTSEAIWSRTPVDARPHGASK